MTMRKYSFVVNVIASKKVCQSEVDRAVEISYDTTTNRVLTPLYLEEYTYEVVANSYEEAVEKINLRCLEIGRRYADEHRFAATLPSCENKEGERV